MTLDEKIRSTLEGTASTVAYVAATSPDEIKRRGRRRRARRRVAWTVPVVMIVLGALAVTVPFDPNPRSPATSPDIDTVEVADLAVAVTDSDPVSTDPDVWLGLRGPSPSFDTSELGPDLSFTTGEPSAGDLDDRVVRAVYLGELEGEPFYIYAAPAPSIWDRIFEVVYGNFSGDVLGTSLNCCSGGDMDHDEGLPGFSHSTSSEDGVVTSEVITAEWLGLSTDVSVVAYQLEGNFIGWQTPVGGVASLRLDELPEEYLAVAFDAVGREVQRFGPIELEPIPEAEQFETSSLLEAEWAPMSSEGSEIQPDDIPTDQLREAISAQPGDRLFLVSVDGGQLIVLVRGNETPLVYSESCDLVASADLPPGWDSICLD